MVFNFKADISAANKYNAKIGQPCFVPLDIEQDFKTKPFFLYLRIGSVYKTFTKAVKLSQKLICKEGEKKNSFDRIKNFFKICK